MLRRLYDWILARAAGRQAEAWYAGISFIDGAILPIPPELLQIPMAIARPERTLRVAAIGAAASAAGALAGYAVGALLYQSVAVPLLTMTGHLGQFQTFLADVGENALLWIVAFFLAPSVTAIAAGSIPLGIAATLAGSLIGRGGRFLIVAVLLRYHGVAAQRLIDRYFHQLALVAGVALAGFVVVRYAL